MRLMRDMIGETLSDRYRIVGRIAGGGMGDVYRGHDLLLDRTVAIKVLQPGLASDPDLVARFRAEARAAARLNHPNVVAVHDWGSADDLIYYMVMEYVAGKDLRDVIVGRGPMDPAHACEVMIAVCDALQAAHSVGLIHRDVKPENVLIARDGTVKVADFGIAAIADAERTLTGGGMLGTLRYIAPEQANGEKASASSDIWAAGAMFFELLTGSTPQGGSGAELLRRRAVEEPEPPSILEPEVPRELDDIVLRACAVDPARRFADAGEMSSAISDAAATIEPRSERVAELFSDVTDEFDLPDMAPTGFVSRGVYRDDRKRRRRVGVLRLLGVVVALAALLLGGWTAAGAVFGPHEVEIPSLVGLSEESARERAGEAGLEIDVVGRERSDLEEGRVISQEPTDGLLLEGEAIGIVVSKGFPLVRVPDLTGTKLDKAKSQLAELNLEVGEVTREFSIEYPKDTVIEFVAEKKRVEQGSSVLLVVSKGPRDVGVPNVINKKAENARTLLEEAGFEVEEVLVYSDDVDEGRVVSTDPAGDTEAPEASTIVMAVSQGPELKTFRMPDVRNQSVGEARAELEGRGLVVNVNSCGSGSTVIETDPLPGTQVTEGDTVVLLVC
jgi:serine/threonine-protein kinase